MRTLQITPKHALLFGLSWRVYDAYESRHRQITQWREQGYTWSAGYKLGPDTYVGLAQNTFDRPPKGRLYAGAALLAVNPKLQRKTCLVLLEAEDVVCAVGMINGNVLLDRAVAHEDVAEVRNEFAHRCAEAGQDFETYGTTRANSAIGDVEHLLLWDDLIAFSSWTGLTTSARLVQFRSDRSQWVALGVIVVVAAGIAVYVWRNHREQQLIRARMEQASRTNSPQALYEAAVRKLLADSQAMAPLARTLVTYQRTLADVPVSRAGWSLSKVRCEVRSALCQVEWGADATRLATYEGFESAQPHLPATWTHTFGPGTARIVTLVPVPITKTALLPRATWPTYQGFLRNEVSQWQKFSGLGLTVDLKEPQVQAVPANVPMQAAQAHPQAVRAVSWSVTNKPWWLAPAFEQAGSTVSLERLSLQFSGKEITFSAEGKAYVR